MREGSVAVAGGGIAGLAAALALARTGRAVDVFEREPERIDEGAGLQLSPNASRHLARWGVLDRLDATALTPQAVVVRRGSDGRELARLRLHDAERRWGAPFRVAHRADLHAVLADAVAAHPTIAVHSGQAVTGWRASADSLQIATGGGEHTACGLLIGDGVHSALGAALTGATAQPSGRMAWRALIPADRCEAFARQPASNLWLGDRAHLVHYPLRGGSMVNVVAIAADNVDPQGASWSQPGDATLIAQRFTGWCPSVRALIAAAPAWRVWPVLAKPAPRRLAFDRVALTGDAAHPMMPFLAQGAAQAIEDAAALERAFAAHQDVAGAFRAYERDRLPRVARVVAASERQALIYHLSGIAAAARDAAMQVAGGAGLRLAADWIWRA